MMFLARFAKANPFLVDAADADAAIERLARETPEAPVELRELPDGLLCCEVRFPDPEDDQDEENPANVNEEVILEALPELAEWLEGIEEEPPAAPVDPTAATDEPPPLEEDDGEADAQAGRRYNPPPRLIDNE